MIDTITCVKCGHQAERIDAIKDFPRRSSNETGFSNWCRKCLDLYSHDIRCARCGFSCLPENAEEHFAHNYRTKTGWNHLCTKCSTAKAKAANWYRTPKKAVKPNGFSVGACQVVPGRYGQRCRHYLITWDCPHYDECLDRAAALNWPGWKSSTDSQEKQT